MAYVGLLLAVLLDNAVRLLLPVQAGLPDLPLVTVLYVGFNAKSTGQLWYAVVLGAFADCFSSCALGHFAFLYGATAYTAWRVRRYLPPDPGLSYIAASLFCALLTAVLALVLALVSTGSAGSAGFVRALLDGVASAASAPLLFGIWSRSRLFRTALSGRRYYQLAS